LIDIRAKFQTETKTKTKTKTKTQIGTKINITINIPELGASTGTPSKTPTSPQTQTIQTQDGEEVTVLKRTINIRHDVAVKEAVRSVGANGVKSPDKTPQSGGISVSRNSSSNTTDLIEAVKSASQSRIMKRNSGSNTDPDSPKERKKIDHNVIQVFRSYRYFHYIYIQIHIYAYIHLFMIFNSF
jgi:hypothetical protein